MNKKAPNYKFSFDDIFTAPGNCGRTENLYQYFQGLLLAEQQEEFKKHLGECDHCAGLLAELQESELAAESVVLDSERADRIFQEGRSRMNRKGAIHRVLVPGIHFPSLTNALLLAVIAILAFPAYRSFVLNRQVTDLESDLQRTKTELQSRATKEPIPQPESIVSLKPTASPSFIYAVRMERDAEPKIIRVSFDSSQTSISLVFSVPVENFQSYHVEIVRGNDRIWQSQIPATSKEISQLLSVHLQRGSLQPGEYGLQITGQRADQKATFPPYKLIVSDSK